MAVTKLLRKLLCLGLVIRAAVTQNSQHPVRFVWHKKNNWKLPGSRLKRFCIYTLTLLLLGASLTARAEVLVGIANVANLTGLNLEWAGERTSYYVVPGFETKSTGLDEDRFHWVAGTRHRLERGLTSTSGFYSGLLIGDFAEHDYQRLGAGADLGYQWVKEYTRITLGSGIVFLEEKPEFNLEAEPELVIGLTISLRK